MVTVQQQSGLQSVIETRHESSCASLHVQGSTVQAMTSISDRVVSEVRLDQSSRPWALLAVVEEERDTKAAYYIRTLLADTVQKVLDNYKPPHPTAKGYVSPLSAALLRLASKFSKICLSETVLGTNTTVAVMDVKLERIYTVMCGTSAQNQLPVVTDHSGEALKAIHSARREVAGVQMQENTFSAPVGHQYRIILGNSGLWQFVHPTKAGLHAAAYASAKSLCTAEHQHDSATAVLRAALRTVVARCAASSSARTAVLNTLSQLDRLSPGSKLEAKQGARNCMIPRMRGDVHPNLTSAVLSIDTSTNRSCLTPSKPSSDALAPGTPEATSSMMSDVSNSAPAQHSDSSPRRAMERNPMRTQSQPDMANFLMRSIGATRKESRLGRSPRGTSTTAATAPSAVANTRSPLGAPPVRSTPPTSVAASSQHSSPRTSQRVSLSADTPVSRASVSRTSAGMPLSIPLTVATAAETRDVASSTAGTAGSGSSAGRPAALNVGWLRTLDYNSALDSQGMALDDTASPPCSPTDASIPVTTLMPSRLHTALESAQGTEGMPAALSLPQLIASSSGSDLHGMHVAEGDEGHAMHGVMRGSCSVGDFECAGVGASSTEGGGVRGPSTEGLAVGAAHCSHREVSRRWLLMQRHVQVLGLERKLRREMWQELLDVALSRSATPSEHGDHGPVQDACEPAPEDTTQKPAEHAQSEKHAGRGGHGRAVSVDAEEKARIKNRFTPGGRRSVGDEVASSCPTSPKGKKNWLGRARERIGLTAF